MGYVDESLDTASFPPGGWFKTGDIGFLDAENYLTITDRKKDIIIRGGENISSKEVEDILATIPGVVESAVYFACVEALQNAANASWRPGARPAWSRISSAARLAVHARSRLM